MNIKTAAEKTGLTKKAIKYYESEGLINSLKRCENNYRDYSEEDIVKLNLIGALRALDIPILDIKDVVAGKKSFQEILMESLTKIEENINHLEKSKLIVTSLIENNLGDYKASGEQIRKLRETLELSRDGKKEFISENLLRIFPGNFGQVFVAMYEPFLRITIDDDEKKKIWLRLVEFLDSADEIDEDTLIIEKTNETYTNKLDGFKRMINDHIKNSLNCYDKVKDSMINDQIQLTKSLKENEEVKDKLGYTSNELIQAFNQEN